MTVSDDSPAHRHVSRDLRPRPTRGALTGAASDADAAIDVDRRVADLSVRDVLDAVRAGTLDRADALNAERRGRQRASLLDSLGG